MTRNDLLEYGSFYEGTNVFVFKCGIPDYYLEGNELIIHDEFSKPKFFPTVLRLSDIRELAKVFNVINK